MQAAPVLLQDPSSLAHDTGSHPEQAGRMVAIDRELAARDWLGYTRLRSPEVSRSVLEAVHTRAHVELIQRAAAAGGGRIDADTVVSPGSFAAALHAVGGAVALVDMLLDGSASVGFSAHRPPGHHAESARAMGFCLFNSVAVAARHALDAGGLQRVMIVDWDVHHGNGTNDIFAADRRVLFVSVHQSPLYPGTGPAGDLGAGEGRGYTVNLPVGPGSGDDVYRSLIDHVAVPLARCFEPQLVLVSAGFDAHLEDPLADCRVTEAGFAALARSLRSVCAELQAPLGGVLEGGYALKALARSVAATLEALRAPAPGGSAGSGESASSGESAGSAGSGESAGSAGSAGSGESAGCVGSGESAGSVGSGESAGSVGSGESAGSVGSGESAGSAGSWESASSGGSGESAGSAGSAGSADGGVGVCGEARRARERLREWWPALAAD